MSARGAPPDRVPTLTEVLAEPPAAPALDESADGVVKAPTDTVDQGPDAADEALLQRLLAHLQPQVDRVIEARLRAAVGPALDALVEQVVADSREALASTLRDGLVQALGQHPTRHRAEPGPR